MSLKLHHVGVVVESIEKAKEFYEKLGLSVGPTYDIKEYNAKVAFIPVGDARIELVEPTNPEDGLGKFLKRGGGLHHVCYTVDNIEEFVSECRAKGVLPVHDELKSDEVFSKVTFLHPKYTKRILIELAKE